MTPETVDRIAARVADHIGRPGDQATIDLARGHVGTVAAFCRTYTRGRGFTPTGDPLPDVEAVIVTAASRLTTNPEQVITYTAADYSERPAVFEGWSAAETGVLHEYRVRWT